MASLIAPAIIKAAAKKFGTDKHALTLDTRFHVNSMLFCHLADCLTLGMKGISRKLNHLGLVKEPSRNTLSRQNKHRNTGVARKIYMRTREKLMGQQPYDCRFRSCIKAVRVLLLDSSMVTPCDKVFKWAGYSKEKGAIKLHALFSFNNFLTVDIFVSDGNGAWHVMPSRRSIIVADRGYNDTALWRAWDSRGGFLKWSFAQIQPSSALQPTEKNHWDTCAENSVGALRLAAGVVGWRSHGNVLHTGRHGAHLPRVLCLYQLADAQLEGTEHLRHVRLREHGGAPH